MVPRNRTMGLKKIVNREENLKRESEQMLKTIGQLTLERNFLQECFRRSGLRVPEPGAEK